MERMQLLLINTLALFIFLTGLLCPAQTNASDDYLISILGIPDGNLGSLLKAGVNTILIREDEIPTAKGLNINKIYITGASASSINKRLGLQQMTARLERYKKLTDAYGFYLGDDLKCKQKAEIQAIRSSLGIKKGMVGLLAGLDCYSDYDVFVYHYPLMRRGLSLRDMLKEQVHKVSIAHSNGQRIFFHVQTHPQIWYKKRMELNKVAQEALLYPDGQAVRMLFYYGLATGGDGLNLYNWQSLSGKYSGERVSGIIQALLESKPLRKAIAGSSGIEFLSGPGNVYGSIVKRSAFDIFFIFTGDDSTVYHPSTNTVSIELKSIAELRRYKSVYLYSPTGMEQAKDSVQVAQDHPLVLIGFKDASDLNRFKFESHELDAYLEALTTRASLLAQNLKTCGVLNLPPLPNVEGEGKHDVSGRISATLSYISRLDAIKRESWQKRSPAHPTDGDLLNEAVWKKRMVRANNVDIFNFYWESSRF
jgi:hypothetical protein